MQKAIEKFFRLSERNSDILTEIRAGLVTFATMAYIVIVNPGILSDPQGAGMNFHAVMVATCVSSAIATLIMGLLANLPIALAPGMGLNAFFSYTICRVMGIPWQGALAMVAISGAVFVILSVTGAGSRIFEAVPASIRTGTAAGIGLFIALIGLQKSGIIASHPVTMLTLGDLKAPHVLLSCAGLLVTAALMAMRVRAAILIGILFTAFLGYIIGLIRVHSVFSVPSFPSTAFHLDFHSLWNAGGLLVIFTLLFVDVFDTLGTFMGLGEAGGFIKNGKFPRINRALFADACGTLTGALLGTSTVTSYIESAAGIVEGGRSGLTAVVVAFLFLIALFLGPLVEVLGQGVTVNGVNYNPVTSPALIIVGVLMVQHMARINWDDFEEAFVAFITMVTIPFTFSISDGLAIGFISFSMLKALRGRFREIGAINLLITLFAIFRFVAG